MWIKQPKTTIHQGLWYPEPVPHGILPFEPAQLVYPQLPPPPRWGQNTRLQVHEVCLWLSTKLKGVSKSQGYHRGQQVSIDVKRPKCFSHLHRTTLKSLCVLPKVTVSPITRNRLTETE
jgi:hypothetical protein